MDESKLTKTLKGAFFGLMNFRKVVIDCYFEYKKERKMILNNFKAAIKRIYDLAHITGY
jgi:hypothetical protein